MFTEASSSPTHPLLMRKDNQSMDVDGAAFFILVIVMMYVIMSVQGKNFESWNMLAK